MLTSETDSLSATGTDTDSDFSAPGRSTRASRASKNLRLPSVALVCDRTGISARSAAMIVSAGLKDANVSGTEKHAVAIIDKSKVRREVSRSCQTAREEHVNVSQPVVALFYDGRKDKTLKLETIGPKKRITTVIEEHIVLLEEPGEKYIGHIAPTGGSAAAIKEAIVNYCSDNSIDLSALCALGADGTPVNTGHINGVIRLLEETFNRPMQWLICLLHCNELPFRRLFTKLDGATSGPTEFSGPIGRQLHHCETLPVVRFRRISFDSPADVDTKTLSADQKIILRYALAADKGECSEDLARVKPGKVAHSRWLTTAARILRLYMSVKAPSSPLETLAVYVMKVYVPVWFDVKCRPRCIDGSRHLFQLIQRSRYLPRESREAVDAVIQRNGFFGHPENVLLAMLFDER